jgi:predicted nuclease of predicted toxin-antitoxin system
VTDRFLANENFPAEIVHFLRERGDDVAHAAETMVAAPDAEIVRAAVREDRVLLTFDRDFGELVFRFKEPPAPGIVLFRGADLPPSFMLAFLKTFFGARPELRGFFTVARPGHFRQVPLARV